MTLLNARSLLPKVDELFAVIAVKLPTVVCITETWLSENVNSSLIDVPGYYVFRDDRCMRRGGGTAVFIRNECSSVKVDCADLRDLNCNCSVIDIISFQLILFCLYIPPSVRAADLHKIHDFLVKAVDDALAKKPQYRCAILGDLNHYNPTKLCVDLNLVDLVELPTRGKNILDHVLISKELKSAYQVNYDCPLGKSDHLMITCFPRHASPSPCQTRLHCVLDLRESHIACLVKAASQVKWAEVVPQDATVDCQWNVFHALLSDLIDTHIPKRFVLMSNRDKEWLTPLTKYLIHERWAAYRSRQWGKYEHLKKKVQQEIIQAKKLWANKLRSSPKGLWKLVNGIQGRSRYIDPLSRLIDENGDIDTLLHNLREKLIDTFAQPQSTPRMSPSIIDSENVCTTWNIKITEYDVWKLVSKLDCSKAPGCDAIPNKVYRCLADIISLPLSVIFNKSISEAEVPASWKRGIIIPIPKSSPPSIDKLRYITLMPVPFKLLERLILRSVQRTFLSAYGSEQHGFRPNASTTTALVRLIHASSSSVNDPSVCALAVASYDMSRAFDTLHCDLAVRKIKEAGFPIGFIHWLTNYFSDRTGQIKIMGKYSIDFPLCKGVPQGSVLGPPIFCVYVREILGSRPDITTVKYADDVNLVIPLRSSAVAEIKARIDTETQHIKQLCTENKLTLNVEKSKVLVYTRRPVSFELPFALPIDSSLKILGVVINSKLNWTSHVDFVAKKCAQRLHIIRKLRNLVSYEELHLVYNALIRSLLEYASPVFVGLNKKLSNRLRKIDTRAHRIMAGCSSGDPYSHCSCVRDSLLQRRITQAEKLYRSIELAPHILSPCLPTRLPTSGHISVPLAHNNTYFHSFFPFMSRHINSQLQITDISHPSH